MKRSLSVIFLILKYVGLWKPYGWEGTKINVYFIYSFILNGLFFVVAISTEITQLYMVLDDLEMTVQAALLLLSHLMQGIKMYTLIENHKEIRDLINSLDNPELNNGKKEAQLIMNKSIIEIGRLINTYFILGSGVMAIWMVWPLTLPEPALPLLAWFPYDLQDPLKFKVTYIYQVLSSYFNCTSHTCLDLLTVTLLSLMATQLDVLSYELESLGKTSEDFDESLKRCVAHHRSIIRFLDKVEFIFKRNVFAQFAATNIILCVTAFQMTQTKNIVELLSMFLYLVGILFQLLLYCYHGHLIILKSHHVSQAAYFSNWFESPVHTRRNVLFIMMMSKKPLSMTVGKIFRLSLQTFSSIVKSSYSYFAVLYQSQN